MHVKTLFDYVIGRSWMQIELGITQHNTCRMKEYSN